VDYSWGWIPVSVFLLFGGYFVRRSSLPRKKRFRILLIIDSMCTLLYVGSFYKDYKSFNFAVFLGLILCLAVSSFVLIRIESNIGKDDL